MHKTILTALILSLISFMAVAQTATPKKAVALHGEPKYQDSFTHFDYTNPDAPKGGTLKLGVVGSFDSLNPFIIRGSAASGLLYLGNSLVHESLMLQNYDEPFSMYGLLAETIELPEDKSWVAFNINPQAKWHDGKPVTADDVVFTFNTLMKDGLPFFKAYYGDVKEVKATSKQRVIFKFKHAGNAELPLIVAQLTILPKHFYAGKDFTKTTLEPPLGSGPYKVLSAEAGRTISYERVKDWWGKDLPVNKGRYNFDRITYDYYKDDTVALEAFLAGQFDLRQENVARIWEQSYKGPNVRSGKIKREVLDHQRPQGIQGFLFNIRRPIFADARVREALGLAFDFEWSNKQFAFNSYTRSASYFENSELAARGLPTAEELKILEQYKGKIPEEAFTKAYAPPKTNGSGNNRDNLRRATELLEAAGYKLGADGIRVNDKGQKLVFEIVDSSPMFERWVLPFIANLKRIGVQATFRTIDAAQYQQRMQTFDFDMTNLIIPQSDSPGNEQREFWGSNAADTNGSRNYIGIKNPVIDEMIEKIIKVESQEELVNRVRAMDRVLLWNHYVIPQWYLGSWRIAYWNKLKHPEKLSGMTPAISDTWWVDPKEGK